MPIFIERFVLPALAAALVLGAIANPMGWDWIQRSSACVAIFFGAIFFAHTIYKATKAPNSATQNSVSNTSTSTFLEIKIPRFKGDTSTTPGSIYFHLDIKNLGEMTAEGCVIKITKITKLIGDSWNNQPMQHHAILSWQGQPPKPDEQKVISEKSFDFGAIKKADNYFRPAYVQSSLQFGTLNPDERFRYYILAEGTNCRIKNGKPAVVEAFWDGVYDERPGAMKDHFVYKKVDFDTAEAETFPA